jgi:hypothetical protein
MVLPADTNTKIEMETLIGLASQIVRRGYGEAVIILALRRSGASQEVARLVAASVVSCHAAILTTHGDARREKEPLDAVDKSDLRAARAASLALSKFVSFFVFVIVGIGGGAFLGWSIGFNQGIDDGFDWIVRTVEQLIAR